MRAPSALRSSDSCVRESKCIKHMTVWLCHKTIASHRNTCIDARTHQHRHAHVSHQISGGARSWSLISSCSVNYSSWWMNSPLLSYLNKPRLKNNPPDVNKCVFLFLTPLLSEVNRRSESQSGMRAECVCLTRCGSLHVHMCASVSVISPSGQMIHYSRATGSGALLAAVVMEASAGNSRSSFSIVFRCWDMGLVFFLSLFLLSGSPSSAPLGECFDNVNILNEWERKWLVKSNSFRNLICVQITGFTSILKYPRNTSYLSFLPCLSNMSFERTPLLIYTRSCSCCAYPLSLRESAIHFHTVAWAHNVNPVTHMCVCVCASVPSIFLHFCFWGWNPRLGAINWLTKEICKNNRDTSIPDVVVYLLEFYFTCYTPILSPWSFKDCTGKIEINK